mmetsp:Transcript_159609/g.306484  ORF Transcript_159609/g.306484 Transcript_159609/m.306484 type:complete len:364 (-) Transcript_159609:18-1109(-)
MEPHSEKTSGAKRNVLRVSPRFHKSSDDKPGVELGSSLDNLVIPSGLRPDLQQICELVLQRGWESIVWQRGFTGLHLAAKQGSEEAVCLLLRATAAPSVDKEDSRGLRPIDYARKRGFPQLLELLDPARVPHLPRSAQGEVLAGRVTDQEAQAALSPRKRQGSNSRSVCMEAELAEAHATASAQQRRILELEGDLLKERAKVQNLQRELALRDQELALIRASHVAAAPDQGRCDVDLTRCQCGGHCDGELTQSVFWLPPDGIRTRRPTEVGIRTRLNTEIGHEEKVSNGFSAEFWEGVLRPSIKGPALLSHALAFADVPSKSGFMDDGDEEAASPCNRIELHGMPNKSEKKKFSFDLTQTLIS